MRTEIKRSLLVILVSAAALIVEAWCIWSFYVSVRMSDDYKSMCALKVGESVDALVDSGMLVLSDCGSRFPEGDLGKVWLGTFFGRKMYVFADERRKVRGVVAADSRSTINSADIDGGCQ